VAGKPGPTKRKKPSKPPAKKASKRTRSSVSASAKKRKTSAAAAPPQPKKKRGRPELIAPAVVDAIVLAISIGSTVETAAAHAGISRDTLHKWMRTGARDRRDGKRSAYALFSDRVSKAMANAELGFLGVIAEAARGREAEPALLDENGKLLRPAIPERKPEWQSAAWWLERRHPERYARRVIHVSEDGAGPGPRANLAPASSPQVLPGIGDAPVAQFTLYLPAEDPLPGVAQLQPPPTGAGSEGDADG
jgi:transposase